MTLLEIAKRAEKLAIDNSPGILTAIGVTGSLTTAYLTGKASFKAAEIIRYEEDLNGTVEPGLPLLKERTKMVWKLYIPAVTTGAITIACIVGANQIGTRRAAAMAAAYSISDKAFTEYKEKVAEKIGANKERAIRDSVAQDQVRENPVVEREVIIAGGGDVLCHEAFTGRYFKSDMETLKKAQNDLNYKVLHNYYASLSDFYNLIDLPTTTVSDEMGWNSDQMLELDFSTVLSEDGRPCISIDFRVAPIRNYYRVC